MRIVDGVLENTLSNTVSSKLRLCTPSVFCQNSIFANWPPTIQGHSVIFIADLVYSTGFSSRHYGYVGRYEVLSTQQKMSVIPENTPTIAGPFPFHTRIQRCRSKNQNL